MSQEKPVLMIYRRNRQFYCYNLRRYTNSQELLTLMREGFRLQVRSKDDEDITRQSLFSILTRNQEVLSETELEQILSRPPATGLPSEQNRSSDNEPVQRSHVDG